MNTAFGLALVALVSGASVFVTALAVWLIIDAVSVVRKWF